MDTLEFIFVLLDTTTFDFREYFYNIMFPYQSEFLFQLLPK